MSDLPSLRDLLDAGCALEATGVWLEGMAEAVFTEIPQLSLAERRRRADVLRDSARIYAEQGAEIQQVWRELWLAEVTEDESLADRLAAALPAALVAHYSSQRDVAKRPHPLVVKLPETAWNCQNCGAIFEQGDQEAVVVTERPPQSMLDYEIHYCFGCIEMVAEASGRAPR